MSLSQTAHADRTHLDGPPVGIALLGCGTVGTGVAHLLLRRSQAISTRAGRPFRLVGVAVRLIDKQRSPAIPSALFTTDAVALISRPDVRLVIECVGGLEAARTFVERALSVGKPVVTANKDLLGTDGPALRSLAASRGASIAYEAAVGGAIPIVRTLLETLAGETIVEVGGVLNGTTNFILDEMSRGAGYEDALASAMRNGFAEADPTNDVAGIDAAHKLAILSQLAFRRAVTTGDVPRRGIEKLAREDLVLARRLRMTIKLLAVARDGEAIVTPAYVRVEHAFAQPAGAHNSIRVIGRGAGTLTFAGAGAGSDPTASAVIADVVATLRAIARGVPSVDDEPMRASDGVLPLALRTIVRLVSFRDARPAREALARAGIEAELLEGVPAIATASPRREPSAVERVLRENGIEPESSIPVWDDADAGVASASGSTISQPA